MGPETGMNIEEIQQQLREQGLDGWLLFDHHGRDPIAYRVLSLDIPPHVSRRWYYWIPAEGEPVKLVHRIEDWMLDPLPGERLVYSRWQEQHEGLRNLLGKASRIAMQYSPNCMIPYVSLVDGGTIDLVRSCGVEVAGSASLVQYFEARWSEAQYESHLEAGRRIDKIRAETFAEIGRRVAAAGTAGECAITEFTIAEFIRERFAAASLVTEDGPIVAVNRNSGNPHYAPTSERSSPIRSGDFVLLDIWAKLNRPAAVYYDITWTGFLGAQPPSEIVNVFEIVRDARDKTVAFVNAEVSAGRAVTGCAADDIARGHIAAKGFGEQFTHRTGHSIGEQVHGNGANIDNLESSDDRPLIARTCFSVEPGVYLPGFGVRSELDCYVSGSGAAATGETQSELVRILG